MAHTTDKAPLFGVLEEGPLVEYTASCHCGALRYIIKCPSLVDPPTQSVVCCNCSICQRKGYLLIYAPRNNVEWVTGYPEKINVYKTLSKSIEHMTCTDCHSAIGIDFKEKVFEGDRLGMNMRMIQGLDIHKMDIRFAKGRDMFSEFNRDW